MTSTTSEALLDFARKLAAKETGVVMDFSDVPNILCETDKYLRVQLGQGRPRTRYQLQAV